MFVFLRKPRKIMVIVVENGRRREIIIPDVGHELFLNRSLKLHNIIIPAHLNDTRLREYVRRAGAASRLDCWNWSRSSRMK